MNTLSHLSEYFKDGQIKNVLDVGTGTGDFMALLKKVLPNAEFTGVDPFEESLNEAIARFPGVVFKKMVAENLEFEDDCFDVASISMALHHLSDIGAALSEMKRVVKPGGWIVVNELVSDELNAAQQVHRMLHHLRSKVDRISGEIHHETYTKQQVREMVASAGIQIENWFTDEMPETFNAETAETEAKVEKLVKHLEKIAGTEDYQMMQPKIAEFREAAIKNGFQQATRIVVIGRV